MDINNDSLMSKTVSDLTVKDGLVLYFGIGTAIWASRVGMKIIETPLKKWMIKMNARLEVKTKAKDDHKPPQGGAYL